MTPRRKSLRRVFYLFLAAKAAIYTCVENVKFALRCRSGPTLHLFIFFFFFDCVFYIMRHRDSSGLSFHLNRGTFGGNLPKRAGSECRINQCKIKEAFERGKMTPLSPFLRLHPCGISLRSMAWLSTDTDMGWQRCFLLPVISQDRSEQSVTHNAPSLAGGLFIAAGVFAHVFPQ